MMRASIMAILILGLVAGQALALPGPGQGRYKIRPGYIDVRNDCDAAVLVNQIVLEPNETQRFLVNVNKNSTEAAVDASLVSDPSVSASHICTVDANKVTPVTVTCSTTASGVSLSIECGKPHKVASFTRTHEAQVALASTGGLGILLLLGTLLGRAPRTRTFMTWDNRAVRHDDFADQCG